MIFFSFSISISFFLPLARKTDRNVFFFSLLFANWLNFFNCQCRHIKWIQKAYANLFQLNQHHEVGNNGTEHAREQIQRDGEEFRTGNCHCLLTLLAYNLHKCFGLFRSIVPVARVGSFHDRWTLLNKIFNFMNL